VSGGAHVLVPLKRLDGAKTRLAGLLGPDERAGLMVAMLADVLHAVAVSALVARVTIVSSEPVAPALARGHGVSAWHDRGLPWNDALAEAMAAVVAEACVAIVSADLPLVRAPEIDHLVRSTPERGLAIARALDGGTNAVVMRPPGVLATCFGTPGSAARHAASARAAGLGAVTVDLPGTALDLDTPQDVERFLELEHPSRAFELLANTPRRTVSRDHALRL
jgi:2-phospho-L-lactate guanylyltransferase